MNILILTLNAVIIAVYGIKAYKTVSNFDRILNIMILIAASITLGMGIIHMLVFQSSVVIF